MAESDSLDAVFSERGAFDETLPGSDRDNGRQAHHAPLRFRDSSRVTGRQDWDLHL